MVNLIIAIAAFTAAMAGQFMDGFTTYIGIYVKKNSTEGDQAGIAQWIAGAPWRLFTIKPALVALAGAGMYVLGVLHNVDVQILSSFLFGAFAYSGFDAAAGNAKINGGWF